MKKVFVLLCLLFLTGCSATYEIKLNDNKIEEKLILIETNQSLFDVENDSGWTLRQTFEALIDESDEFSVQEYSTKSLSNDEQLGVEYYSDKTVDLLNSTALNQCYINPKMEVDGNIVSLNTGDQFTCYDYYNNLETIQIVLTTNHKVISSNADVVDGNKYTWTLTKDGNKQLEFSYDKTVVNKNNLLIVILFVSFITIVAVVLGYAYYKRKKESQL